MVPPIDATADELAKLNHYRVTILYSIQYYMRLLNKI